MKSRFFIREKRLLDDLYDDNALKLVHNYKSSKLRRKLNSSCSKNDENKVCAICLDICVNQCSPNDCSHQFCYVCISLWGKVSPICPLCKVEFHSVLNSAGEILETFMKKKSDDENMSEGEFTEDPDEDVVNRLQFQDTSHGYHLDGFVVDDDFVEFDE